MNTKLILSPLLLLSMLTELAVAAPMGTAFTYQGKLTSGTNAANGTYDFSFALWNAPTLGVNQGPTIATDNQPLP